MIIPIKFFQFWSRWNVVMFSIGFLLFTETGFAQTSLSLKDALEQGIANYGTIKAKKHYADASNERKDRIKRDYLPNINLSAQQSYGTINGQNGPLYGLGGLGVGSSGLPLPEQNWNAAFGSLYLVNVNWDVFTFGKIKQRIEVSKKEAQQSELDYQQEIFNHQVKISTAYLNLLASQRLQISQEKNLDRAEILKRYIVARVKGGLLPGVDSTMAAAEVSRAKISLNQVMEQVKIQNNELAQIIGYEIRDFQTDTLFVSKEPENFEALDESSTGSTMHPVRQFYKSRIAVSEEQTTLFRKNFWPTISLFGIHQFRGSGFNPDYATNQNSFTTNYFDGISPTRQNYLFGLGIVWNLTSIPRAKKDISYQKNITQGLEEEYKVIDMQLKTQENTANASMDFALKNVREAPLQVAAAQQAYNQRLNLYRNGLTNLTDLTTAQYALNRAETDRDIAAVNIWQALLMKAAATGNFTLFSNEF